MYQQFSIQFHPNNMRINEAEWYHGCQLREWMRCCKWKPDQSYLVTRCHEQLSAAIHTHHGVRSVTVHTSPTCTSEYLQVDRACNGTIGIEGEVFYSSIHEHVVIAHRRGCIWGILERLLFQLWSIRDALPSTTSAARVSGYLHLVGNIQDPGAAHSTIV